MKNTLRTTMIAAAVSLGALAALPAAANADGLYLGFNLGPYPGSNGYAWRHDDDRAAPRHDDRRHDDWRRDDRRHDDWRHDDWRHDDWRHDDWRGRTCSPNDAVRTAERMGIDHAYVARVGRDVIRVDGRRWRQWVAVTFARAPGCPVVR